MAQNEIIARVISFILDINKVVCKARGQREVIIKPEELTEKELAETINEFFTGFGSGKVTIKFLSEKGGKQATITAGDIFLSTN